MELKIGIACSLVFLVVSSLSAFADTTEIKSVESSKNTDEKSDVVSSETDDSKEKRPQEDIMFGNQQNKNVGSINDAMGMSEKAEATIQKDHDDQGKNDTYGDQENDDSKLEDVLKDSPKEDDKRDLQDDLVDLNDMGPGGSEVASKWYSSAPVTTNALHYLLNSAPIQEIPSVEEDIGSIYSQDEMYRRKRQLDSQLVRVRKRSLRMPLGQMIQARGRRLPRRSMRLKRQVDVEELLSLLAGNDGSGNNPGRAYDEAIPNSVNRYRYPELPYHLGNNFMDQAYEDEMEDESDLDRREDLPESILYPPGGRYLDLPDFPQTYRSRQNGNTETDQGQSPFRWRNIEQLRPRYPATSLLSVSRRSSPLFYPIDYRYVPSGFKKRSSMVDENDLDDRDYGKWGKIVQVPEAYASAEDVAKLYALASLMGQKEGEDNRKRRGNQ